MPITVTPAAKFFEHLGITTKEVDEIVSRVKVERAEDDEGKNKGLTPKEYEVFSMMGQCHSSKKISEDLRISVKTLDIHRANIKRKLGLPNNAAVVRAWVLWAIKGKVA